MSTESFLISNSVLSTRYSVLSSYDLIRSRENVRRDRQANLLRRFHVDYQLELRGSFDRHFGRFGSLQNFIDQGGYACVAFRLVKPVGHQTALSNKFFPIMNGWQAMFCG